MVLPARRGTMTPGVLVARQPSAGAAIAVLIAAAAAATLAAVWTMQQAGYVPCELCLLERNPYYVGVPLALATAVAARAGAPRLAQAGFVLLALVFVVSAGLAAYHAGVEYQFWAGPSGCSGPLAAPGNVADFLKQLQTVKVVRCDAPALVVLGLSLAGWNVPVSLLLATLALVGARGADRAVRVP